MYFQIREAEGQGLKILRVMDERREAMALQADGLQQKLAAMGEQEENLRVDGRQEATQPPQERCCQWSEG